MGSNAAADAEMPLPITGTTKDKTRRRRRRASAKGGDRNGNGSGTGNGKDDDDAVGKQTFEEVPVADSDYSSDSDAVAEALAIGKQFLKKRNKDDIIDAAYNRTLSFFFFSRKTDQT